MCDNIIFNFIKEKNEMLNTESSAALEVAMPAPRKKSIKKALAITGLSLLGIIVIVVILVAILFGSEIASMATVSRVGDTELFTMNFKGDYGFDSFLAQGASSDAEVVSFISKQLLKGLPLKFDLPELGCSTFAAVTPDGDHIFGRNFDNFNTPVLVVTTHPSDGYASISVVNLAFVGYNEAFMPIGLTDRFLTLASPFAPLDGVNEKGVSIGVLQLDTAPTQQDTGKTNITTTTAIRLVLDKAASVDEALALLQQYDMRSSAGASYHFQIADATGKSVVVEYLDNAFTVIDSAYATNFVLAPGKWYNDGGGQDRFAILAQKFAETGGVLTEQQGMDLLNAVHQSNQYPTQWSVVYNETKKTAELCLKSDYDDVYPFSLK